MPKRSCEEISAAVEFNSKYYPDLCYSLVVDTVYGLFKRDDQPLHLNSDVVNYGPVWNLS